jgi:holliday junction DNA helicase RuvA
VIGLLRGVVWDRGVDGSCIVDVRGVGYELWMPLGTLGRLPPPPEEVTLHVHTHVREEAITLFGFDSSTERAAFRTMLGVSGVGPKLALAVFTALSAQQLAQAVAAGDRTVFKGIPGVGNKTAERLLLELRDKLPAIGAIGAASTAHAPAPRPLVQGPLATVHGALVHMGFKQSEADAAVARIEGAEGRAPEDLVVEALRYLT